MLAYHHVWKCGGSNLCDMARRNNERVPNGADSVSPSDRCDLAPDQLSLAGFQRANESFGAWQYPLPRNLPGLGDPESELAFLTLMRNPLDQALSHYRHVRDYYGPPELFPSFEAFLDFGLCAARGLEGVREEEDREGKVEEVEANYAPPRRPDTGENKAKECAAFFTPEALKGKAGGVSQVFWELPFAVWRDNQQLRWLLPTGDGSVEDLAGAGRKLSAEDLERGKSRLGLFDQVMILEDFDRTERFRLSRYGWINFEEDGAPRRRSNATGELAPRVLLKLQKLQRWDLELYSFAQSLARGQRDREEREARL